MALLRRKKNCTKRRREEDHVAPDLLNLPALLSPPSLSQFMDNCLYKQTSYYSPGLIDDVTDKPTYLTCKTAISLSIPHVFCMTTTFFAAVFVLINQGRLSFYSNISIVKTLTHLKLYFRTYLVNTIGPRYSGI